MSVYRNFVLTLSCIVIFTTLPLTVGTNPSNNTNNKIKEGRHKCNKLLSWNEETGNFRGRFPYYVSGYDNEDRPILVLEWGKWDIRSLAEKGGQDLEDFEDCMDNFVNLVKEGFYDKKVGANESAMTHGEYIGVGDFNGLDYRQAATAKSMGLFLRTMSKFALTADEYTYGYVINANPFAHQILNVGKPLMGKLLERTEIYGTNSRRWIPQVLKKLPRSQVRREYGGFRDFRPVVVYSFI